MDKNLTKFFAVVLILIISGCGFHLRGQVPLPEYLDKPYVKGNDLELVQALESELLALSARPKNTIVDASSVLELLRASYLREVGSLDRRGKVTGYVLKYEVVYRVLTPDRKTLIEDTILTLSRSLDYDRGEVLQLQRDERLLRDELVDELAKQIVKRILTISQPAISPVSASIWEEHLEGPVI